MRRSEFWRLMEEEFGAGYAPTLYREQVLDDLADRTPEQAVAAGVPLREVWFALCEAMSVPPSRRWGRDLRREAGTRGDGRG